MIFRLSFSLRSTGIFRWDPYFLFEEPWGFRATPFGNGSISGPMKCSCQKSLNILVFFLPFRGGGGGGGESSPAGHAQDPTACKYCIPHIRCWCPVWHVLVRKITSYLVIRNLFANLQNQHNEITKPEFATQQAVLSNAILLRNDALSSLDRTSPNGRMGGE